MTDSGQSDTQLDSLSEPGDPPDMLRSIDGLEHCADCGGRIVKVPNGWACDTCERWVEE